MITSILLFAFYGASVLTLLGSVIWWLTRKDRGRIRQEASRQGVTVRSICWCLWPFSSYGPFGGMRLGKGVRLYRVTCDDHSAQRRVAYVMIRPGNFLAADDHDTFSWRWTAVQGLPPVPAE